jgi:Ca2+:H+ antiporter
VGGLTRTERVGIGVVLVFTALAGVARYVSAINHIIAFVLAGIALGGGAWIVSFATEQVGGRFGVATTGMLQSTLGNLPEFFVVLFALRAGELVVAQTALLGSVLVNALLVLVLVGLADATHGAVATHGKTISIVGAAVLLVVYGFWARQFLTTAGPEETEEGETPRLSQAGALTLLVLAGAASGFVSDWFVHALEPTIHSLHISTAFAGLVIVAIAGNAVEHAVGIVLASRGRSELAISVIKASVGQVAAFLFPLMVLVSLATSTTLTFSLGPVFTGALALSALIVWQITGDGEATAFEGAALIAVFVVIAVAAAYQ